MCKLKKICLVLVIIASLFLCIVPAYAHRDNNPATNLVKIPGVTVTDNGYLEAGREGINAILNPDRTADPQTDWTGAFHSSNRTGPSDYVTLTITFPTAQTFDRIAWNSGSVAGSTWWGPDQAWWADANGSTIVKQYSSGDSVSNLHDPTGSTPVGGQHEMAMFAPVTATSLTLTFTPISRAGGWYWSVRDIHVWLDNSNWEQQNGDTLAATDTLGRCLPGYTDCGGPKSGKYVAIMYEPWILDDQGTPVYDIPYILSQPDPKPWGCVGCFHWWSQPELGYYSYAYYDTYVMRKGVQMLSDAGVDVLVVDVSNGYTYDIQCRRLFNVLQDMSYYGLKVPKVMFYVYTNNVATVQRLYDIYYSQNFYSDLWFYWDSKPLMWGLKDGITNQTILDFFTWRKPVNVAVNQDEWSGGQEFYPQNYGWHVNSSTPEEMSVSVAQKETYMSAPTARGRSYHNGSQPPSGQTDYSGRNFQEQWDRALSVMETANPAFVYLTSWNEWIVQRVSTNNEFTDQYTEEFSRDIEPMLGEHGDNYYYQMVGNIRKFKGVTQPSLWAASQNMAIDGNFADWDNVSPVCVDTPGDAPNENYPAWGQSYYENTTGRNDIITSIVAYDSSYVYFYVETASPLTSHTDPDWMRLLIDSDCDGTTGWEGYDFIINDPPIPSSTTTTLKANNGGSWNWNYVRDASYRVAGNEMEIAVLRSDIGQSGSYPALNFKWSDNQAPANPEDFSASGDSAPDRLFSYHYTTELVAPVAGTSTPPASVTTATISVPYSGASDANSGLKKVELWYKEQGHSWVNSGLTKTAGSDTFTFTPPGSGRYYFDLVAQDNAGNRSAVASGNGDGATIFKLWWSDGFESGNFTAGGWTNSGCNIDSTYRNSGTYSARFNYSDSLTKSYSTVGKSDIKIEYARMTRQCESSDHFLSQWSINGSTWTTMEDLAGDSSWTVKQYSLPSGANNQSGFRIRFRTSGNGSADYAYLDDVKIIGL